MCKGEILNRVREDSQAGAQDRIDEVLGASERRNVGFTLNPCKHKIDVNFFDPSHAFADRKLVVLSLTRDDILAQAISRFVSRQESGRSPADRSARSAIPLLETVARGVELPADTMAAMVKAFAAWTRECRDFARTFAAGFDEQAIEITYEGVYGPDSKDLYRLFDALAVESDIPLPDTGEKLLPPPENFVRNYSEIRAIADAILSGAH